MTGLHFCRVHKIEYAPDVVRAELDDICRLMTEMYDIAPSFWCNEALTHMEIDREELLAVADRLRKEGFPSDFTPINTDMNSTELADFFEDAAKNSDHEDDTVYFEWF